MATYKLAVTLLVTLSLLSCAGMAPVNPSYEYYLNDTYIEPDYSYLTDSEIEARKRRLDSQAQVLAHDRYRVRYGGPQRCTGTGLLGAIGNHYCTSNIEETVRELY